MVPAKKRKPMNRTYLCWQVYRNFEHEFFALDAYDTYQSLAILLPY